MMTSALDAMQKLAQETGLDLSDDNLSVGQPSTDDQPSTFPDEEPAPVAPAPITPQEAPRSPQEHHVPLATYLTEREEKAALKRQLDELQAQRRQEPEAEPPDPFLDPTGFARHQARQELDSRLQQQLNPVLEQFRLSIAHNNRATAHSVYGDVAVKAAIDEFDKEMPPTITDPASQIERMRVLNSPNPFLAAVEWQQRRQVLAEVGTDPKAYRERVLAEALADPEFLGRAIEAARPVAAANPGLPPPKASAKLPSVNRAGSGAGSQPVKAPAESDDEIVDWATNPKSTRPT